MLTNDLPQRMLNEPTNRRILVEWRRRAVIDDAETWPDDEVIEIARGIEYDATPERLERFCEQTPQAAADVLSNRRHWSATSIVAFVSWLEAKRWWLPGEIHRVKKYGVEVDADNGLVADDIDAFAAEDIIRFLAMELDGAVRMGLAICLEKKLGIR